MIEFLVLFFGVYGALAIPHTPYVNHDPRHHLDNNAELPGIENLSEKELPLSRLFTASNLPPNNNLAERSQIPQQLPGTGNLAEKRIPDDVLKRLSQPSDIK